MNHSPKIYTTHGRSLAAALVLLTAGALVLRAQTAPAGAGGEAPSTASLNQDVQGLQRLYDQLHSQVDILTEQNKQLQKQVLTSQEITTLIQTSVQNAIAKSRSEIGVEVGKSMDTASDNLRKQIMTEVAGQIQALATDMDTQLKKLAKAIGDKPVAVAVSTPPPKPLPPDTKLDIITLKSGDSVTKIMQVYHVSRDEILAANPQIADLNKIRAGQQIAIPHKDGATSPAATTGR